MEPVMLAICQTFAESPACQTIQNKNFLCGFLCDTPDCLASVTFWEDLLLAGLAEVQ